MAEPVVAVRMVPLGKLKPYPSNPRKIPAKAVEQTAASLKEFGWQQPIVTDADYVIIAGHTRLQAARQLGMKAAPVVIAEGLTPEQVRAYRIADNRTHDYATWDFPVLMQELDGLDDQFAGVLDLADWRGIIDGFEADQAERDLALADDVNAMLRGEFMLTVVFQTQAEAEAAGPQILDLPGVVNVRYSGRPE